MPDPILTSQREVHFTTAILDGKPVFTHCIQVWTAPDMGESEPEPEPKTIPSKRALVKSWLVLDCSSPDPSRELKVPRSGPSLPNTGLHHIDMLHWPW